MGLNGTGEANDRATMRAIARAMEIMGNPTVDGLPSSRVSRNCKKIKNVAMVMVTATVPATGARRGDQVDCYVSALNGKSLDGGRLAFASLQGPNTQDDRGVRVVPRTGDDRRPDAADGGRGARRAARWKPTCSRRSTATATSRWSWTRITPIFKRPPRSSTRFEQKLGYSEAGDAKAAEHRHGAGDRRGEHRRADSASCTCDDPVEFASDLLELRIEEPRPESRVVINPRAGTIVISGDVEIGDVIVSHKNVMVEATTATARLRRSTSIKSSKPKLQQLVESAQFAEGADGGHDRDHSRHRAERQAARAVDY